tara:strand:+ start:1515 stop:1862 length:348 start_codon:yes stop_codon:yes gene_type:complete
MTLQTTPQHEIRKRNDGSFEKPSGGISAQAYSGKWVYTVPDGKYAIVTVSWNNESYGFYVYTSQQSNQYAQIGNWGTSTVDAGAKVTENLRLYAGMSIKAGSSTDVAVVGLEYDL